MRITVIFPSEKAVLPRLCTGAVHANKNMKHIKAIVILGGGLVKDKDNKWRTTSFEEGDEYGALGDRLRVIAGSYLYKNNPEIKIIALGGKGQLKDIPDAPTVAQVIKNELVEQGVNKKDIILNEESDTTFEQLLDLKNIIKKGGFANLIVISNQYHLPRIKAMIEYNKEPKEIFSTKKVQFRSAEEILIMQDHKWKAEIDEAYNSKAMKQRIALEKKGIKDIKEGKYKF